MYEMSQNYCNHCGPRLSYNCNYGHSSNSGYNTLENRIADYSIILPELSYQSATAQSIPQSISHYQFQSTPTTSTTSNLTFPTFPTLQYHSSPHVSYKNQLLSYQSSFLQSNFQPNYNFIPQDFLKPGKEGIFINTSEEVKRYIEETFQKLFNKPFPTNIKISLLEEKKFRILAPHPGTIGLSINRGKQSLLSEIFVLKGTLGPVLLTIGHELGHVLSETLPNPHDEEAKAYAFSLLWMKTIKENNVAGLKDAIILEHPAENGLHNVAFNFVHQLILCGRSITEIYNELILKELSLT